MNNFEKDFKSLVSIFSYMDVLLRRSLFPWTLITSNGFKLSESETELEKNYNSFGVRYENLIHLCKSLVTNLKEAGYPNGYIESKNNEFSETVDDEIKSTTRLANTVLSNEQFANDNRIHMIWSMYVAYTMCAQSLNCLIKVYNEKVPEYPLQELQSIPDWGAGIGNLKTLTDFLQKYDTFEKLEKVCQ